MTQYGYEPLSPDDSGSTLLERLNGVVPALLTNHKGAARPGYVQPGMIWIDDSGALWLLNLFDGANDVPIATVDPVTHSLAVIGKRLTIDGGAAEQERLEFRAGGAPKWALLRDADDAFAIVNEMLGATAVSFDKATNKANFAQAPMIAGVSLAAMLGGLKNVRFITASGNVQPTAGCTKWLGFLVGGGANGNGTPGTMGAGGSGGGGCLFLATVSDASQYAVTIGGIGGTSKVIIEAGTYSAGGGVVGPDGGGVASGGLINLKGGTSGEVGYSGGSGNNWSFGGDGGDGPFGLGKGGPGIIYSAYQYGNTSRNGLPGSGYGAGGGGAAGMNNAGTGTGGAGTPGCLLLLEF